MKRSWKTRGLPIAPQEGVWLWHSPTLVGDGYGAPSVPPFLYIPAQPHQAYSPPLGCNSEDSLCEPALELDFSHRQHGEWAALVPCGPQVALKAPFPEPEPVAPVCTPPAAGSSLPVCWPRSTSCAKAECLPLYSHVTCPKGHAQVPLVCLFPWSLHGCPVPLCGSTSGLPALQGPYASFPQLGTAWRGGLKVQPGTHGLPGCERA